MVQNEAGCGDGPPVSTLAQAVKISTAVAEVARKQSQPARLLLCDTSSVATAPPMQIMIE